MTFAAITLPELAPILTIFVGMLAGFYALVKFILAQSEKTAESDREERKEMSLAFNRVAEATERSANEAKERNGHLGEQNIKIAELVKRQNNDVGEIKKSNQKIADVLSKSALIAAEDRDILTGSSQVVHEQVVEHQVINKLEES